MAWPMILAEFEQLVRTPADVDRLNEAILELAVRGRLVSQDPADEPASALLARIQAEKQRLEEAGEIRPSKPLPQVKAAEMPFPLTEGWVWARLGGIAKQIHYGYTASADHTLRDFRLLRITDIQDNRVLWDTVPGCEITFEDAQKYLLADGDILIARTGGTIGKTYLIEGISVQAVFASYLIRVIPAIGISPRYLKLFLESPLYWSQLREESKGTGQPNVNATSLGNLITPLPPLAEQKRIVAALDSLLARTAALKASLAAAQAERETLAAAALHRLETAADPAQSAAAWALIRENFAALFDTPQSVAALKQTILQLAVQGKLVAQDAADEPASALLSRIRAEKQRLEEAGEMRASKPLARVTAGEMPFPLPAGWVWCRLGNAVIELQTGPFGSTLHKADYVANGIPIVNPVNIQDGQIRVLEEMTVDARTRDRLQRYVLGRGDIVMGRRGEMGRCAAITEREAGWLCGSGSFAIKNSAEIDPEYLVRVIRSPSAREYLAGDSVGATMNNLNHRVLANLILGLPPLAEQKRIVARVDALFALCDGLAAGLADGEALRARWVAAVLAGV